MGRKQKLRQERTRNTNKRVTNKRKLSSSLHLHQHHSHWIVMLLVIPVFLFYQWKIINDYRVTLFVSSVLSQQQQRTPVLIENVQQVNTMSSIIQQLKGYYYYYYYDTNNSTALVQDAEKNPNATFDPQQRKDNTEIGIYTVQASDDITPPTTRIVHTVPLNATNSSLHPIHTTGCCGLGHRLNLNLRTFVYAIRQGRTSKVHWPDVPWSVLFHDTDSIAEGIGHEGWNIAKQQGLFFSNYFPEHWSGLPTRNQTETGTAMDRFDPNLLDNPLGISILVSLRDSLTPLVLSYLTPIRAQLNQHKQEKKKNKNHVTICTHVRQGNNEMGDWQRKKWRHIDLHTIMTATQRAMEQLVLVRNATTASIFVASDNGDVTPWFEANIPKKWTVIQPGKRMPKPETGVWFGQHGSGTNRILNQTMKNEVLAEAMADVFALGECEVLLIPNFSTFSYAGIALTQARGKSVYFGKKNKGDDDEEFSYLEMK